MDWLFQLSAACVVAAALMFPIFRLFVPTPRRSLVAYRPAKAAPR